MRRIAGLAVAAIALATASGACRSAEPSPPLSGRAPPVPPPSVAWRDRAIAITGLPAVASDGSAVVLAWRDLDGERGNANLTLLEKDRSDKLVHRQEVLTASEAAQLDAAAIDRRFDAATRWLAERHAADQLLALPALAVRPATDLSPAEATGSDAYVRWTPHDFVIRTQSEPPLTLFHQTPESWLAADRPMCATCSEPCHFPPALDRVYLDAGRRIAVFVIAYRGSDACGAPSPEAHVVTW